jgi:hypothetical protein
VNLFPVQPFSPAVHLLPTFATFVARLLGITLAFGGSFDVSLAVTAFFEVDFVDPEVLEEVPFVAELVVGVVVVEGVVVGAAAAPEAAGILMICARPEELLLERPMRTPTPMARSSVATPAINVLLAVMRNRPAGRGAAYRAVELVSDTGAG